MKVVPSPDLPENQYLPGIGKDGADLPDKEAQALIDSGLAVKAPAPEKEGKSGHVLPSAASDDGADVLLADAEGAA